MKISTKSVKRVLENILLTLCIISLSFIIIIVFINIFFRYFFSGSLGWPQEVATHIIVWTTYTGIGVCISRGEILKIDVFINKFGKKIQKRIKIVNSFIVLFISFFLFRQFFRLYDIQKARYLASLNVPQSLGIIGAIFSFCLIIPLLMLNIFEMIGKQKEG